MQKDRAISITTTALVICSACSNIATSTQPTRVHYSNTAEIRKAFNDHRTEFDIVKDSLLTEPAKSFTVESHSAGKDPVYSARTFSLCDRLMDKIDSFTTIRLNNLIRFELNHAHARNKVSDWAIVYDPERRFTQPKSRFGTARTLEELAPSWFIVVDAVDVSNFPIRIERTKPETNSLPTQTQ